MSRDPLDQHPRARLAHLPTPLVKVPALDADVDLWAKFVWPTEGEGLERAAGLVNLPVPLDEGASKALLHFIQLHRESNGPMTAKQYELLSGLLDKRYDKGSHRAILSAVCAMPVTADNRPGYEVKLLIDALKENLPERMQKLDAIVDALKQDLAGS